MSASTGVSSSAVPSMKRSSGMLPLSSGSALPRSVAPVCVMSAALRMAGLSLGSVVKLMMLLRMAVRPLSASRQKW